MATSVRGFGDDAQGLYPEVRAAVAALPSPDQGFE